MGKGKHSTHSVAARCNEQMHIGSIYKLLQCIHSKIHLRRRELRKQFPYRIPANETGKRTYVVTVLDRMQNESKGVKCKVKL